MLRRFVLALFAVCTFFGSTGSAALASSTGVWTAAKSLNLARSGATATLLSDGRVLVAGGFDSSGNPTSSVEIYNLDGTVTPVTAMNAARANHAAIALQNNDVLVAGGISIAGGNATNSAEIYDPAQNTWTQVSAMGQARAGHTLSLLLDGNVLVAAGTNASGGVSLLETFDSNTNSFTPRGTLVTPRANHAAAVLHNGRVMVIGGISAADMTTILSSTEIFDPTTGTVTAGPSLNTARSGHTATTTLNGTVVVIGGTNPSLSDKGSPAELATAEIFDPSAATPAFVQSASKLASARAGHLAFLLPHNANVLIVGGTAAGASLASVEIYTPWTDTFQGTGSLAAARSAAAGTALLTVTGAGTEGALLVSGGQNSTGALASGELYSFATVKTDAGDYPPGDIVTITGTGWQPGETVTLAFREYPSIDTPGPYTTVADANGNILDMEFAPDSNDLNIRFYLTATGTSSGLQAQHTFTDSVTTATSLTCMASSVQVGQPLSCTAITTPTGSSASLEGYIVFSVSPSNAGTFSNFVAVATDNSQACGTNGTPTKNFSCMVSYTPSMLGSQTITACYSSTNPGKNPSCGSSSSFTITVTPDLVLDAPTPNPVNYGSTGPVTFTAHLTSGTAAITPATVSFSVDGITVGSASTDSSGTATFSTYNPSALSVGGHTVQASFAGATIGSIPYSAATSNQQMLTVTQINTTISINAPTITYGSNGSVTVTVIPGSGSGTPTGSVSLSFNGGTAVTKTLSGGTYTFICSDISGLCTPPANKTGYSLSATYTATAGNGFAGSTGSGTLIVNQLEITLTAGGYSGVYDGNSHALSACTSSNSNFVTCTNSPAGPEGPDVGSGTVTPTPVYATGSVAADYTITPVSGSWSITPLAVTVTGGSYSGVYDGTSHALTACASSYVGVTCTNNPTGPVGPDVGGAAVVPVAAVGTGIAADYSITAKNGSWSITPLAVSLTAGSLTGIYNGSAQSPSACTSSKSSFVTCTNNPATVGPDVVTAVTITPTPVYAVGSASDYAITYNNGSATISPLAVTVTGGSYSGVYDGTSHALTACASSYVGVTCTNNPTGPVGPDVGGAAVVPVAAVGTGIAADYTITPVNGSWSITPLAVSLTAGSLTGIYNGSAQSPSACTSSKSSFVTCTNSPTTVGPDVVTAATITPTPVYAVGSASDYSITYNNGSATISPLAVTVTGGGYSGVYDGTSHALTACVSSYAGVTCTNNPTGPVGPDVSSGTVTPTAAYALGSIATDYTITPVNGSWSITPLAVTVTAGSLTGIYNGSAQSPSACTSSKSSFVTCTNSPTTVGPDVVTAATITPVPVYATGSIAGDYAITYNNGSATIAPLAVTVTGGSYSGVYDGTSHALTACASSYVGVTCTNNPTGPVGPDVGGAAVVPVSAVGTGIADDYTITAKNGSWSITPLAVTLTAGSYNNVFDGFAHSPSTCTSTSPLLPCTDSPASVGPSVGSGTVLPVPGPYTPSDFTINKIGGTWSISAYPLTATVTISQNPAVPTTAYQYSDPAIITVSFSAPGPLPMISGTTATVSFGTQTFSNLKFTCNTATPVVCSASTAAPTDAAAVYLMQAPGQYSVTVAYPNGFDPNFTINKPTTNFSITQEDAAVTYTGNTYFSVPPTQTTVNVPVSFTLQDATATGTSSAIYDAYPGDITKTGTVNITLSGSYITSNSSTSNYSASCTNVPVSAVPGQVGSNGLPSTALTGSCTFSGVPASAGTYQLTITPGTGSYYTFPSGYDTNIQIGTYNGGSGFITGGGYQTASYLNSNPTGSSPSTAPAGYLLGEKPLAAKMNFGYMAKYNKSGSNLQASVNVIVRTSCMSGTDITALGITGYTPKAGDDKLCAYQIKSNKVISMSDVAYLSACTPTSTTCSPGYGVLIVGANLQDVTGPTPVAVTGNLQLQLTMYDNGEPGSGTNAAPDTLTLHLTDSKGNLWFSNSWSGTKTVIMNGTTTKNNVDQYAPAINGGNLQVH